jgi:hypothetical protein
MAMILLAVTLSEYNDLRASLRESKYRVITGYVRDFVPEGPGGHPRERFTVGNAEFEYGTSDITSAFHQTSTHGGPISAGLPVRITEVDGSIIRLEIRAGCGVSAPAGT